MSKIFNKLRLILIVTVIFITLLFAILIYRQHITFQSDIEAMESYNLQNFSNQIRLTENSYETLAMSFYESFFIDNSEIFDLMTKASEANSKPLFNGLLMRIYHHLSQMDFSYIRLYDSKRQLISTFPGITNSEETYYTYSYTLGTSEKFLGYVEFGLSVNTIIDSLKDTTGMTLFPTFNSTLASITSFDQDQLPNGYWHYIFNENSFLSTSNQKNMASIFSNRTMSSIFDHIVFQNSHTIKARMGKDDTFCLHYFKDTTYYSISMSSIHTNINSIPGYYMLFSTDETMTTVLYNSQVNIRLMIGLYITLLFLVGFVYYVLSYLYHFSYQDSLTKIFNRHKFYDVIDRYVYDFHRYESHFAVILIDIDNFKSINDTFGHSTGDRILVEFAERLNNSIRTTDYIFRWGGEEFLILLSHCNEDSALQVSEKLRQAIETYDFKLNSNFPVTASFGIATYKDIHSVEAMIAHADQALYDSKNKGKNTSTLYTADSH